MPSAVTVSMTMASPTSAVSVCSCSRSPWSLIGFVFLWAFLDSLRVGKPTKKAEAWINGGSPTKDFLSSLHGTFADQFREVAG